MKWVLMILATMAIASVAGSQDKPAESPQHAPSVDQCRADAALWYADRAISQHSFAELSARAEEMAKCSIVDNDKVTYVKYVGVLGGCQNESYARMLDFLTRNQLMDKFISEDAQGKR